MDSDNKKKLERALIETINIRSTDCAKRYQDQEVQMVFKLKTKT